ncbi:MAG TPA: hypothetical protein VEI04_11415 [Syntrophobacteria bacterium]|nr:hypothetical protein [Syntrophobacteria bacterium]
MARDNIEVALYQGKRGGMAMGVAESVALAFIYVIVFHFVPSLGYSGGLRAAVTAWAPNGFLGLAASSP